MEVVEKPVGRSPLIRYAVLIAAWVFALSTFYLAWDALPPSVAVKFDFRGHPVGFMSREQNFSFVIMLLLIFTVTSVAVKESLRTTRAGMPGAVMAGVLDGAITIIVIAHDFILRFNLHQDRFDIRIAGCFAAAAAVVGFLLERGSIAPVDLDPETATAPSPSGLEIRPGSSFLLQQRGNPRWWNIMCLLPALIGILEYPLLRSAGNAAFSASLFVLVALGVVQILLLPFINGFTFVASTNGIEVRLGLFKLLVKRIPWNQIREVALIQNFSAFEHFCGWGWRTNLKRKSTGYVLTNGEAVRISTPDWNYFLTMPNAGAFADIARQAATAAS